MLLMALQAVVLRVSLRVSGVRRDIRSFLRESNPLSQTRSHLPPRIHQYVARSLPVAVASCAFLGAAVGVYDSAGKLAGDKRERDSPETWEERRRKFFKQKSSDSADA